MTQSQDFRERDGVGQREGKEQNGPGVNGLWGWGDGEGRELIGWLKVMVLYLCPRNTQKSAHINNYQHCSTTIYTKLESHVNDTS